MKANSMAKCCLVLGTVRIPRSGPAGYCGAPPARIFRHTRCALKTDRSWFACPKNKSPLDLCSKTPYNGHTEAFLLEEPHRMQGRSHLFIGLTAGVVLDSFVHLSGPPLTMATSVPLELLVKKGVFYFAVGFGALLPDMDNARSTIGRKLGWVSKEIQHVAGHRTIFHSLLGLF